MKITLYIITILCVIIAAIGLISSALSGAPAIVQQTNSLLSLAFAVLPYVLARSVEKLIDEARKK